MFRVILMSSVIPVLAIVARGDTALEDRQSCGVLPTNQQGLMLKSECERLENTYLIINHIELQDRRRGPVSVEWKSAILSTGPDYWVEPGSRTTVTYPCCGLGPAPQPYDASEAWGIDYSVIARSNAGATRFSAPAYAPIPRIIWLAARNVPFSLPSGISRLFRVTATVERRDRTYVYSYVGENLSQDRIHLHWTSVLAPDLAESNGWRGWLEPGEVTELFRGEGALGPVQLQDVLRFGAHPEWPELEHLGDESTLERRLVELGDRGLDAPYGYILAPAVVDVAWLRARVDL